MTVTLNISYDPQSFEADINCSEPGTHWEAIRRVCQEASTEVRVISSSHLKLPWWAFLSCRKAIGYHAAKYNFNVVISPRATALLNEVIASEAKVANAASIPPLEEKYVLERINAQLIDRELKSYQLRNIRKLARLNVGATFSVPGSGKTTEALSFFNLLASQNSRLLVIAPKNAFAAWEEQILFWRIPHQFERLIGGRTAIKNLLSRNPTLMLITYQQFPRVLNEIAEYLEQYPDSFIFLDESHKIKSGTSGVIASSILRIAHLAPKKLVMSGTPLPNALADLIPQVQFIAPEINANLQNIDSLVQPLYVRTRKSELNLREPERREIKIPLAPIQRYLYDQIKSEIALQANKALNSRQRQAARRIGRSAMLLLQFVSNPALLAKRNFQYSDLLGEVLNEGDSPKVAYACQRARELAAINKKVIVWSGFVENVEIIAERLKDLGADYIHGGVEASSDLDEASREYKIKKFHDDDKVMVLVANPAACSEGISLHTVCHHAIYVDRNYNAAQYLQSEDRIHRIGLRPNQKTIIEILTSPGTIDDAVSKRLAQKIDLMGEVLNDADLKFRAVSFDPERDELDDLDIQSVKDHLRSAE